MVCKWHLLGICGLLFLGGCVDFLYPAQGYVMSPLHPTPTQLTQVDISISSGYLKDPGLFDIDLVYKGNYTQIGGTFSSIGNTLLFQGQLNVGYGGLEDFGKGPYGNIYLLGGIAPGNKVKIHLGVWGGAFFHYLYTFYPDLLTPFTYYFSINYLTIPHVYELHNNNRVYAAYPVMGIYVGTQWTINREGKTPWNCMIRWLPGFGGGLQFAFMHERLQLMLGTPVLLSIGAISYGSFPPLSIGFSWSLTKK